MHLEFLRCNSALAAQACGIADRIQNNRCWFFTQEQVEQKVIFQQQNKVKKSPQEENPGSICQWPDCAENVPSQILHQLKTKKVSTCTNRILFSSKFKTSDGETAQIQNVYIRSRRIVGWTYWQMGQAPLAGVSRAHSLAKVSEISRDVSEWICIATGEGVYPYTQFAFSWIL